MIQETEDDRLDQSLRDTFSDFDLPPSSHVWAGIESHLLALPGAPRPLPLLLVLPIVGLVGVTVGWLLPRATTVTPSPRPASESIPKTRLAGLRTQVFTSAGTAYIIPRSSTEALAFRHASKQVAASVAEHTNKPTEVTALPKAKSRHFASRPTPQPELVASVNTLTPIELLPLRAVSSVEELPTVSVVQEQLPNVSRIAPATDLPSNSIVIVAPPIELGQKGEGLREWHPEYRVPTHRLAERGRGLRRIQKNFVRHWQHLFGPHRARVAAQPDF